VRDIDSDAGIRLLSASAVPLLLTGTTAETALAEIQIPGGALGPHGIVRLTSSWSWTANANNKTLRTRLGGLAGTILRSTVQTTNLMIFEIVMFGNQGAANSQKVFQPLSTVTPFNVSSAAQPTAAIDTSLTQSLVISGQLANAGDSVTLEAYLLELIGVKPANQ